MPSNALDKRAMSQARLVVLYQRQHTLRWVLGELNTFALLDEIPEED